VAMLPETRDALARYDEWLARTLKSPEALAAGARRVERQARHVGRRLRNMLLAAASVVIGALLFGAFITPLGFGGIVATVLLAMCAMLLFSSWPPIPEPKLEALPQVPLKALPAQVEDWLEGQRRLLPPPATRDVDRILVQLHQLTPAMARLEPGSPLAEDARRLLGDHLPRLVKTYAEVPPTHRATPEATGHLREGLKVVGTELDRLSAALARDSLTALEVEGRFLESRWQPGKGSVDRGEKA